jgi:hypothetical protein
MYGILYLYKKISRYKKRRVRMKKFCILLSLQLTSMSMTSNTMDIKEKKERDEEGRKTLTSSQPMNIPGLEGRPPRRRLTKEERKKMRREELPELMYAQTVEDEGRTPPGTPSPVYFPYSSSSPLAMTLITTSRAFAYTTPPKTDAYWEK